MEGCGADRNRSSAFDGTYGKASSCARKQERGCALPVGRQEKGLKAPAGPLSRYARPRGGEEKKETNTELGCEEGGLNRLEWR